MGFRITTLGEILIDFTQNGVDDKCSRKSTWRPADG